MSFNKKLQNVVDIIGELESLGKKLYLDSPDLWVDFADKTSENDIDEMALFFATKYDSLPIVKFAIENDIIDLDAPSKNSNFKTIREHILEACKQFNSKDIYDFITNYKKEENMNSSSDNKEVEPIKEEVSNEKETILEDEKNATCESKTDDITSKGDSENKSSYEPKFICPNCGCNMLSSGYKVSEEVIYKFSKDQQSTTEVTRSINNCISCCNCDYTIKDLTPAFLENICTIQNCKSCGSDLTSTGIATKTNLVYDGDSNTFVPLETTTHHCQKCNGKLTEYQVNYFRL